MTNYVWRPYAPILTPSIPVGGTSAGYFATSIWGAGIRANMYPLRIKMVKNSAPAFPLNLYRVDSAVLNNSSIAPPVAPVPLRQGAPSATCTTAVGTVAFYSSNGSNPTTTWSISGAIPSGSMMLLGGSLSEAIRPVLTDLGSNDASSSTYEFPDEVLIQPGSAFWMGSDFTAYSSAAYPLARSGAVAANNTGYNITGSYGPRFFSTVVHFEEIQENWTT